MKKIIATLITVFVLITSIVLPVSALSQSVRGQANDSTVVFYITVSDEEMRSCNGSFAVSGATVTSVSLAGNGTLSVNGNSYSYTGGTSATIEVVCRATGSSATLTARDATILDSQGRAVGVADGATKSISISTTTTKKTTTTTTAPVDDKTTTTTTTTTTEEATDETTTEEEITEEKASTTTTTTEIVIAPTVPRNQNDSGNGVGSKLTIVLIVVAAILLIAFAIGILLGKRRGEAIKYKSSENIEDILGDIEDGFEDSAD